MDNKLSELSKPVAQIYYDEHDSSVMRIGWLRSDEPKNPGPLYSQEYVSALLAELEATRKQSQELAKQCGRLGARAAIAERKLATPVRLPDIEFVKISGIDFPVMRADIVKKEIRHAGFKVEGDA